MNCHDCINCPITVPAYCSASYCVDAYRQKFEPFENQCPFVTIDRLTLALADAIRRPMGVVPESAKEFINGEMLDAAEQRRPK